MIHRNTSPIKNFAFYGAPVHQKNLEQIETFLKLNEHFSAPWELANSVQNTLVFCQNITDKLTPKREVFLTAIQSVLDKNIGFCMLRSNSITHFVLIRSLISVYSDHPFRFYPIDFSPFPKSVIGMPK